MSKPRRITRRRFLARSAVALAAAPCIIPASALGRDGAVAPSDRIRMGFIGLGTQGGGHLFGGAWTYVPGGYLTREEVQVLAVCDVWKHKREAAKERVNRFYADRSGAGSYKGCEAYSDFRDVLARDDIDAVLMALPAHWHGMMAAMAARAGKDVYCEKPMCLTVRMGRAVADTVKRYGRVYQAGTQQRSEYGGKFRWACELVRNGRIGKLKEIYTYREPGGFTSKGWTTQTGKSVPEGLDYDLEIGPAPWRPYPGHSLTFMFGFGGINWGPHHFDIVQWGLGPDRVGPVEIGMEKGVVVCRYADGVVVRACAYPGEPVGGAGGACFVGTEGRIAVDRGSIVSHPPDILREPLRPEDLRLYKSTSHSGNFLECVRTRKQTICDADTAHRAISVLLLGGIAMTLKRPLKWDPVKEQFPGDDEANRLLSYAPRPPWRL